MLTKLKVTFNTMKINNTPIFDSNSKFIQCHGSSIIKVDNVYFWYGENKDKITENSLDPKSKCKFWHHGMKLYSSKDFISWKDEGFIQKESKDPKNPFYGKNIVDRPHILYNEKNHKFILWAKTSIRGGFDNCKFSIAIGSKLKNLEYIKDVSIPSFSCGDFDLFIFNNKPYIVFAAQNCMILSELNDDYTDFNGVWSKHLEFPYPPYVREAPAVFEHNGRLFMLTSGTTGYYPNVTICYDITNLHGEWKEINKPCIDDKKNISYNLQFSSVFKNDDQYIAVGDRWLTDFAVDSPDMREVFKHIYSHGKEEGLKITDEELKHISKADVSTGRVIFLEIQFDENGIPTIPNSNNY